jgi:hypothetical protein
MTCRGKVAGGVVVLDKPNALPEGAEVKVEVVVTTPSRKRPSLAQKLRKWGGHAKGLPADLAQQHDHYLYGVPKR